MVPSHATASSAPATSAPRLNSGTAWRKVVGTHSAIATGRLVTATATKTSIKISPAPTPGLTASARPVAQASSTAGAPTASARKF